MSKHHRYIRRAREPIAGMRHVQRQARRLLTAAMVLSTWTLAPGPAEAEVFHSKESALRLAFPDADEVKKQEVFLSDAERAEVERLARAKLASRMVTMYEGRKGGAVTGYAFIETHPVRTLPETILIVLEPDGRTRGIHMLAFHEPPEYGPPERWLNQFKGRLLDEDLSLRGDVAAITGATLTATAITAAARRVLAVHRVTIGSTTDSDTTLERPDRAGE